MSQSKHLIVGSAETYSGKSAAILGVGFQLMQQGVTIAYGKPLEGSESELHRQTDDDVQFISESLRLTDDQKRPTVLTLNAATIQKFMAGQITTDYGAQLRQYLEVANEDLVLLEGPDTLSAGQLFGLSLLQMAQILDAQALLVARYHSPLVVDSILDTKQQLGDRLLGVLINDIPDDEWERVNADVKPFLEQQQIPVLGLLPRNDILRSVSVGELVRLLGADVICCPDRMDLMVESLKIGAMNVNSALKYFRKAHNMAVVTGGDRTDLQLAALETSTHCLILTGQLPPMDTVRHRAEDLEIPVLSVDLDTLTTVEIIDRAFGQVRFREAIKVQCIQELMAQHFDLQRLMDVLDLKSAVTV
ncbi:MAG: phosphotransacetylase family protein [Leptolyngbyaceae bacterium]|nr:phosphotransacetylase family protein [Leptolyngbyaceae bacterium]